MRLSQKQIILLISAAIVITTLVAYEPIRHNGFVNYDDNDYIFDNAQVKSGITWESLGQAFTKPHSFMWHPLTTISHMLDYQLFGLNPLGHHLVSILIHIANALLLFWILKNITGTMWASAFVAGIFALHPIQVESVAWAAERKTVLSGLFWLLTMAAYIRYARQPGFGRYLVVLLVFGLCIMTKPVVVTLPFALLLLDYWPLERVRWGQNNKTAAKTTPNQKSAGWLIAEKIPLLGMSAFLSVMTFVSQKQGGVVSTIEGMPLNYRVANMFFSYIRYIGKLIWPNGLAVCYSYPLVTLSNFWVMICAILFIALTVVIVYCIGRQKKYAMVGWLWYVGTLVPVIGLVQSGAQAMANRYMYIPMLGLLLIVGWAVKDYIDKQPRAKILAIILGVAVLSSLFVLTRMQVRHWQNSLTLFEYTLNVTENNPIAENNYGVALFNDGRIEETEPHLRKAISLAPAFVTAITNLAKVNMKQGKYNETVANLYEVIKHNEATADTYYDMATALEMQKKYDEAIKYYAKSLEMNPEDPAANKRMGIALLAAGKINEAIGYAKRACELTGDKDAECLDALASAFAAAGKFGEAARIAEKALNAARISGRKNLIADIQKQIELYQAGMRDRQK